MTLFKQISKHLYLNNIIRKLSTNTKSTKNENVKRIVYVSKSHDIYENLALEDWIYKNVDCNEQNILMLWTNEPCVVIGRHQNPWLEANINDLKSIAGGVKLARRNSGGGTVYHDTGNLNLTFFTTREQYNRKENLQFIQQVLKDKFNTFIEINKREDLVIDDNKISGTAAKLGRLASYHHCTLLVNANKANLSLALKKQIGEIKTNATQSVKSKIMNLQEVNKSLDINNLLIAMGESYLAKNQSEINSFNIIEPSEDKFAGFEKLKQDLQSWDWIFGRTPKFTISRNFSIPSYIVEDTKDELKVEVIVENAIIEDVSISLPLSFMSNTFDHSYSIINNIKGQKFTSDTLEYLENHIKETALQDDEHSKFLVDCVKKVVMNTS